MRATSLEPIRRRFTGAHGMTLIESLVATLILAVSAVGLVSAFAGSRNSGSYAEKHNVATTMAEKELLRVSALPWTEISLKKSEVSTWSAGASTTEPSHYFSKGPCAVGETLPAHEPCYQYDWEGKKAAEPLVTVESGYDKEADPYGFATETAKKTTRLSGKVYRYITWVNDSNCVGAVGNTCRSESTETNAKRITVAVTVTGMKVPVVLTTVYVNPKGGTKNPIVNGAKCKDEETKTSVPCVN